MAYSEFEPPVEQGSKLSWEDTARAMASADEDWSAWDVVLSDGLEDVPWRDDKPRSS
jgi:hypothetical protein